jgi:hypothetical protein
MSAKSRKIMFLESRERPVRKADNLTATCECRRVDNVGSSSSQNPIGLHAVTGIALLSVLHGLYAFSNTELTIPKQTNSVA